MRGFDDGHAPLDQKLAEIDLPFVKRLELNALVLLLSIARPIYWGIRRVRNKPFDLRSDLDAFKDLPSDTRGTRTAERDGNAYLTREQIAEYETRGVIGPLPLLTTEEAADMRAFALEAQEADWYGTTIIGPQVVELLKQNDQWALDDGSMWQERNFKEVRDVATHPVLAERVASLVGDDVVVWRSQLVEVLAGADGTYWHCATTFVEDGDLPALTPPPDIPPSMVNVTCWIALEDVGPENSCMRIIPGTMRDSRLDTIFQRLARDRFGWVLSYRGRALKRTLLAIRYSELFTTVQLAFEKAMGEAPGLYDGFEPTSYPMRAGECLLFSSNNLHGSFPNPSSSSRVSMIVRLTSADVGIYEGQPTIPFFHGSGTTDISTAPFNHGIPVHDAGGAVASAGRDDGELVDLRDRRESYEAVGDPSGAATQR